ncbi:malonyl CoA-ACP transacylase [Rheinheimera sp.]|uniref:malonyl CoA-ACP transacylase n=1 Tax=Rheinheimera sp. TaxID=1869214 RepID=UPI00273622E9|nr:malonyl CoA-ACP transacylase [Rheinheimera sp.]MDP2713179.1 malonyl CoA-ACP transacylase [Rheinheimera sp.]
MKKTALVVCPGRGTYNKAELGYISQHCEDSILLAQFDSVRANAGLATLSELDRQTVFSRSMHLKAENAAALIFAAGVVDYRSINTAQFDVVAVTGNSMGWYTALGCAGVLAADNGMQLVTDMAQLTAGGVGAQFIYPVIDDNWQPDAERAALVQHQLALHEGALFMSIVYGGYAVLAGSEAAVKAAMAALPPCDERFPLLLPGHAAFHTGFMQAASDKALALWPAARFNQPQLSLVDGRGRIWPDGGSDLAALQRYTLQHQVCQPYNFSKALQVAVKEFAPEHIILLGPGASLGGAVAQSLIEINWQGLRAKQDFIAAQQAAIPFVLSMGLPEQRRLLL